MCDQPVRPLCNTPPCHCREKCAEKTEEFLRRCFYSPVSSKRKGVPTGWAHNMPTGCLLLYTHATGSNGIRGILGAMSVAAQYATLKPSSGTVAL